MGKIGDLIVRLQLKHEDYEKGLKKAEKETKGFGAALGKIKGVGVAVWAAIGATVTKFAQNLIASTNRMGDAWATFTEKSKAKWDAFYSAVSSWDFSNFISRMRDASRAAEAYASALDSEFEANNSIRLQKAAMAGENAALKVIMADQTKTFDERIEAAKQYLANIEPIYSQILAQAKKMEDAHLGKWLAGTGLGDSEQVRQDLRKFLVEIGKNDELSSQLLYLVKNRERYSMTLSNLRSEHLAERAREPLMTFKKEYEAAQQFVKNYGATAGFGTSLYDMYRVYNNMRGDKGTGPLVDAMIAAGEAAGMYDEQTKEVQSVLSGLINQAAAAALKAAAEEEAKSPRALLQKATDEIIAGIEEINLIEEIEPIDWDAILGDYNKPLDEFVEKWRATQEDVAKLNEMLGNAITQSLSEGTQALVKCIMGIEGADASQVLAALLQPFAQTMISLGEILLAEGTAVEVFKTSLSSLQGAPAIAAGLGLIALGSALSAGIQALAGSTSKSASAGGVGAADTSSNRSFETYEQEITVHVVGEIAGDKIVLAGQKTLNKWNR